MSDSTIDQLMREAERCFQSRLYFEAINFCRQVCLQEPNHADAHALLGTIAMVLGQAELAQQHLTRALSSNPSLVSAASNLAVLYRSSGRPDLARDLLRQVVAQAPQFAEAHHNLGNALLSLEDFDGAIRAFEEAVRIRPNYTKALINLGRAYRKILRVDLYRDCLRRALNYQATPLAQSNLTFISMFAPEVSAEQVAALAEEWDARFAAPLRKTEADKETGRQGDRERPLRIGYVSPNFRAHSNAFLIEPVMAHHDRERFHLHLYSDTTPPDAVTERFRSYARVFRETVGLSHEQLTEQIRCDEIDILVDLNVHMGGSRLEVFARRAAPIQINYLAYPFTCGLHTMDYRVGDAILDPPGQPSLGPEALIRLRTSFWLFWPDPGFPEPAEQLPARASGQVTFADFNATQKLNPGLAAVWARMLNRVPGSRILQLSDQPAALRPHFDRLFASAGVDPTRIELVGKEKVPEYLARYRIADLCLDPFPYGGHTTTLDSLWMGVPVLTLAGKAPYMRAAASILPRVGLEELVTHAIEEYEEKAVALASDLDRLEALRHDLRSRMSRSVLCDVPGFVADYERGLHEAWKRYCEGKPPAEIDLNQL